MSFILPGNARSLRFTGEAKAFVSEEPKPGNSVSLGKPRVRKQSAPPPRVPNPSHITTPSPGVDPSAPITTPTPGVGPNARILTPRPAVGPSTPITTPVPTFPARTPLMRPPMESFSDDNPTTAMDRDDVLPGAIRTVKPPAAPNAPAIPHFRPRVVQPVAAPPPNPNTGSKHVKTAGPPYALWLVASVIAGLVSYHLAPEILVRLEPPASASDR